MSYISGNRTFYPYKNVFIHFIKLPSEKLNTWANCSLANYLLAAQASRFLIYPLFLSHSQLEITVVEIDCPRKGKKLTESYKKNVPQRTSILYYRRT